MRNAPEQWEYKTTPGSDNDYCTVYAVKGRAVAQYVLPKDARLIVKAPELLELVRHVLGHLTRSYAIMDWVDEATAILDSIDNP